MQGKQRIYDSNLATRFNPPSAGLERKVYNTSNIHGNNNQTSHPVSVPSHEVFVGNLSYFCQEHDLFTLFDEYSHAKNVRIVWNEDHSRPLMYGFVVLASQQEVMEIKKLLDGHLFMGRHLR